MRGCAVTRPCTALQRSKASSVSLVLLSSVSADRRQRSGARLLAAISASPAQAAAMLGGPRAVTQPPPSSSAPGSSAELVWEVLYSAVAT